MFHRLGADAGFDSTNDQCIVTGISKLMNDLDKSEELPKTILYCLNEQDYGALSPLVNSFQDGKTRGKIQLGAAWWFNDNFEGMENQMKRLSSTLLISLFVGMLTDSRSFLSYPRHEYFRREMCNYIAQLVEKGRYPYDVKTLRQIVEDISYNNAIQYFIGK
jgi:glucuronate isomerase